MERDAVVMGEKKEHPSAIIFFIYLQKKHEANPCEA
jgi:hypothetical protein